MTRQSLALAAFLIAGACAAKSGAQLRLSADLSALDLKVENTGLEPLQYSPDMLVKLPASLGQLQLDVLDAKGRPIRMCAYVDRLGEGENKTLAPGAAIHLFVDRIELERVYCLAKGTYYKARVNFQLSKREVASSNTLELLSQNPGLPTLKKSNGEI